MRIIERININAFLFSTATGIAVVAMPLKLIDLKQGSFSLGFSGGIMNGLYSAVCLFVGLIIQKTGPKKVFLTGISIYAVGLLLFYLADSAVMIYMLSMTVGLAAALIWPSLSSWLSWKVGDEGLKKALGGYNVGWCSGMIAGPIIGGVAYQHFKSYAFLLSAIVCVFCLFYLLGEKEYFVRNKEPKPVSKREKNEGWSRNKAFILLLISWIANFSVYFAVANCRFVFPKLSSDLGISGGLLGVILAGINIGQAVIFMSFSNADFWQNKTRFIFLAHLGTITGLALLWTSWNWILFMTACTIIGASSGVTYFASIYYSLNKQEDKGMKSGIHETIIGAGFFIGPILGGIVADKIDIRFPYLLSMVVIAISALTIFILKTNSKIQAPNNKQT